MITPMNWWQKLIAYSSLAIVLAWTVWGIYAMYLILTHRP
jgi:hypothetical protein